MTRLYVPALLLTGCLPTVDFGGFEPPAPQRDTLDPRVLQSPVTVLRVIDGDTIVVQIESLQETVRFRGVDTPELYPPPAEPFALEAQNFTTARAGTQVELVFDSSCPEPVFQTCRDSYDRLLAYIRLSDGADLAGELLQAGLAKVYIFKDEFFDKRVEYETLEAAAQAANIGIWSL